MKKRIIAVIMTFFLLISSNFMISFADSGWDYAYDYDYGSDWGGSDWDYGSDWGYDYDYGGGSYSGGTIDGVVIIIGILFFILLFIVFPSKINIGQNRTNGYNSNSYSNIPTLLSDDVFSEYHNFNKEKFLTEVFEIYKGIQVAWSEFDYDTLRKLTTDEMYNMYKMQLETLNIKSEKNIMKDFNKTFIGVTDISEVNGVLAVKVRLNVSQKDYVINSITGQVTRGNANTSFNVAYDLTFVNNVKKEILNNCPNCGAPISNTGSQKCEYCNADLIGNSVDNWVLAKKETIKQWR